MTVSECQHKQTTLACGSGGANGTYLRSPDCQVQLSR